MKLQIRIDRNAKGKFDVQFLRGGKLLYFSNQDYSRITDAKKTLMCFLSSVQDWNTESTCIGPDGKKWW